MRSHHPRPWMHGISQISPSPRLAQAPGVTSSGKGGLGGQREVARAVLVQRTEQHLAGIGQWLLWASEEAEEALSQGGDFRRCGSGRWPEEEPRGDHTHSFWNLLWPWILGGVQSLQGKEPSLRQT